MNETSHEPVPATAQGATLLTPDQQEHLRRLMYYLRRVTSCFASDDLEDYMTNHRQYATLTIEQSRRVLEMAQKFNPKDLIGKIIIQDETVQFEANTGDHDRRYKRIAPRTGEFDVLGRKVKVVNALCCNAAFLHRYYGKPMEQLPQAIFGSKHCPHCLGDMNRCTCSKCQRFSWTLCTKADVPPAQVLLVTSTAWHFLTYLQVSTALPSSTQLPQHDVRR